ncbi:hypothetical protein JF536_11545 [Priestia flexa]|uniref:hypothetical protein n=1 Tax=Priestia flexa TaxID=86664 RepID=UPI001A8E9BD8|nr:hypothetical protein [Priestia flexa]MBN8434730.1 hypothetical protein [Priestia flexa]MCA0967268.1 hypothetical protein [Priestia flexa]
MAIVKSIMVDVFGKELIFERAYYEISQINGSKEYINFTVNIYDNDNKRNLVKQQYYMFTPLITFNSFNIFRQAYEYMMSLPEFEGAIPLIED